MVDHQTILVEMLRFFWSFWHPCQPWGCISSAWNKERVKSPNVPCIRVITLNKHKQGDFLWVQNLWTQETHFNTEFRRSQNLLNWWIQEIAKSPELVSLYTWRMLVPRQRGFGDQQNLLQAWGRSPSFQSPGLQEILWSPNPLRLGTILRP